MENTIYRLYVRENGVIVEHIDFGTLGELNKWLEFLEISFNEKYKNVGYYNTHDRQNNLDVLTYIYELVK